MKDSSNIPSKQATGMSAAEQVKTTNREDIIQNYTAQMGSV